MSISRPVGAAFLAVIAACLLLYPLPAHAYLDPASGSLFLQMLLGGIAGAALIIRMYWHKLLSLVGLRSDDSDSEV